MPACRRLGHVRRDCRVPKNDDCLNFGNTKKRCVRTNATVTIGAAAHSSSKHMVNEFEAEAAQVGLQLKNFEEATSLAEQAFSSESAQEDSDDPPAEEDVDEPQASTVDAQTDAETTVTQAEVRTSDAEPKDFGVAIKKAKKTGNTPRPRTSSTVSQGSVDMAVQSCLASKRTVNLESSSSVALGLVQPRKDGLLKKGRYNPSPNIPKEARKKPMN